MSHQPRVRRMFQLLDHLKKPKPANGLRSSPKQYVLCSGFEAGEVQEQSKSKEKEIVGRLKKLGGKLSAKISEKVTAILSARSEFMSRRLGRLVIQIISMNSS